MSRYAHQMKKVIPYVLGVVLLIIFFIYGYQSLRHDIVLIAKRERNVFNLFERRVDLASPADLLSFVESGYSWFSSFPDAKAYVYGYELTSRERYALYPIVNVGRSKIANYKYILSYPEVTGVYLLTNDKILTGVSNNKSSIPEKLPETHYDLFKFPPWIHYFDCAQFKQWNKLCNESGYYVSDISTDVLSQKKIFAIYYPYHYFDTVRSAYRYGLTGIDIDVKSAFKNALNPFEKNNPTFSLVSFTIDKCPRLYFCFRQEMMRTASKTPLFIIWGYSISDFIYKQLASSSFRTIVIVYLLFFLGWNKLSHVILTFFNTDKLTGLPRREIFDEKSFHRYNYLLILDIDNFKSINDTWGHDTGDVVLRSFAAKIKIQLRGDDKAFRWGGEEFLILIKSPVTIENLRPLIMRLLEPLVGIEEIEQPITFSGGLVKITPSHTLSSAIKIADNLLYEVKRSGKHNVAYKQAGKVLLFK
ncbi:GGDEF domain-containing protein [Aeromonas veronii]|uniref:GGDEF domain-containing protein n=1 Tax=Aeromonas veronii TaxID=654 RepID=UPI0040558533